MTRRDSPPTTEDLRTRLRAARLRCTSARLSVMEYLASATSPQSHGDVAEALASRGFDRATIYRNLIELAEAGLVARVDLGDHVWRFELRQAGNHRDLDHPHFVCLDCGEVSCLPNFSVSIKSIPGGKESGIREITEILLKGRCDHCQ